MKDPKIKASDDTKEETRGPSILEELEELLNDKEEYRP